MLLDRVRDRVMYGQLVATVPCKDGQGGLFLYKRIGMGIAPMYTIVAKRVEGTFVVQSSENDIPDMAASGYEPNLGYPKRHRAPRYSLCSACSACSKCSGYPIPMYQIGDASHFQPAPVDYMPTGFAGGQWGGVDPRTYRTDVPFSHYCPPDFVEPRPCSRSQYEFPREATGMTGKQMSLRGRRF